ncbi:hypothetical protein [Streptomyces auratus]|uniref:Uncharacterized protein n=1 Tax=Streptomyces auratus AGR0001 TaxID=1160718 RepID=J2JPZ9_9ACTN|nr:hypothetical protein [Streptomyces auratus]
MLDGGLSEASRVAGVSLTEYFVTDRARWLWRFRLDQMAADPGQARWMVRQAIVGDTTGRRSRYRFPDWLRGG